MNDWISEYKQSLKQVRQAIRKIERKDAPTEEDQVQMSLLRGMERDLLWSIEWMETGREPKKQQKIERLSKKQREKIMDPYLLDQSVVGWELPTYRTQNIDIKKIMGILSPREQEIFIMNRVQLISYQEIAQLLGIKKTTVANKIERSKKKIERLVNKFS